MSNTIPPAEIAWKRSRYGFAALHLLSLLFVWWVVRLVLWPRWMKARQRRQERVRERLAAVQARVSELQDQFADDPDALSDAVNSLYREHHVKAGCLKDPQIIVAVLYSLAVYVPALYSARRQALHDRLAHAAVIRTN